MNDNEMHSEDRESVPPEAEAKRKPHKLLIAAAITLAAGLAILVPALILGDPFLAVLAIMCACAAIVLLIIWLIRRFAYTREHKLRTNALVPVFSVVAYLLTPAFLFAGLSIVFFVYVIGGLLLIVALALPFLALALGKLHYAFAEHEPVYAVFGGAAAGKGVCLSGGAPEREARDSSVPDRVFFPLFL